MTTTADTYNLFGSMESEHAGRGLRFFRNGLGHTPMQAFGELDGQHFYFRFRHDNATLEVGPHDEQLELAIFTMRQSRRAAQMADGSYIAGFGIFDEAPEAPGGKYLPARTTAFAQIVDATGDGYADLTLDEFRQLFNRLLAALEPVPEHRQVPGWTVEQLTGSGLWPLATVSRVVGATQG